MEPDDPKDARAVVVALCRGAGEAELVRSLLESCGIPCLVGSDISRLAGPLTVPDLGDVRVSVPAAAAAEAVAILSASPQAAPAARPLFTVIEGGLSGKRKEGAG